MNIPPPSRTKRDGSPLRPITFGRHMQVDGETVRRLEHLFSLGIRYREMECDAEDGCIATAAHEYLEAVAAECCELLGFDPLSEDFYSEAAKSIVLYGCEVAEVMEAISDNLAIRRHLQSTGELSDGD